MRVRTYSIALIALLASASLVMACSVPVFRYALEHWRADHYAAIVFHDGELTDAQQNIIAKMQPKGFDGRPAANMFVKAVNINDIGQNPTLQGLWEQHPSETLPWVVVQSPPKWGPPQTVWTGELTAENTALLLNSPVRTQLKKKLVKGESVVWVFLECGRKAEDDAAFATLETELARLEIKIKPPEIEEVDLADLLISPESLKIAFSAVRLSRNDPNEKPFVEMLLRVEPDLRDEPFINQPIAFPIFGRGRALYALTGDAIAPDLIEEASQFLVGACQCTVKAQNPGVDLLIHKDWDHSITPTQLADEPLPPLAGFEEFALTASNEIEEQTFSQITRDETDDTSSSEAVTKESVATDSLDLAASSASDRGTNVGTPPALASDIPKNLLLVLGLLLAVTVFVSFLLSPRKS